MKIGILIGRFLPLHNGHTFLINLSATKVDKLIIIVSNAYKDWDNNKNMEEIFKKNNLRFPSLRDRVKWLTHIYKDTKHISVTSLKKSNGKVLKKYSKEWFYCLSKTINFKNENEFSFFTNENCAFNNFNKYLPNVKINILGKNVQNLVSSEIREDINKYWGSISSQVRSFFTKKICFVGAESAGKTTLTKTMAKLFNTSWSEEYGRKYTEQIGAFYDSSGMILFSPQDYENILIGQYIQNEQAFNTSNKITLIDTDAVYTKWFMESEYGKNSSIVKWDIVNSHIQKQKEEYIYIFLEPNIPFINDGLRLDNAKNNDVKEFYKEHAIKFDFIVDGKNYEERFWQTYNFMNYIVNGKKGKNE